MEVAAARQGYIVWHSLVGSGCCAGGAGADLRFIIVGEVDVKGQGLLTICADRHVGGIYLDKVT